MSESNSAAASLPYDLTAQDGRVICQLDGQPVHVIQTHLKKNHPTVSANDYRAQFPGAPMLSEKAQAALAKKKAERESVTANMSGVAEAKSSKVVSLKTSKVPDYGIRSADFMKLAENVKGMAAGIAIPVSVFERHDHQDMVPATDDEYIWTPET